MENAKNITGDGKATGENPNPTTAAEADPSPASPGRPSRTPFTNLSQVDADLALARALQEQERAFMMLRLSAGDGSDYESSESGSYVEEDGTDGEDEELDLSEFESDEAFARALQEAEGRDLADRLMALAGLNGRNDEDHGDESGSDEDASEDVGLDELSYEELTALGEVVGIERRGLSDDTIAALPSVNYKAESVQDANADQCVICRLDYEDGESLVVLRCKHTYHPECINKWLQINKACPVCKAEVSPSENKGN